MDPSVAKAKSIFLAYCLLLLAVALAGIVVIAAVPPFEGFDEIAHWSRLQQRADTGRDAAYGQAYISTDIQAYPGPMPYDAPGIGKASPTYATFRHSGAPSFVGRPTTFHPSTTVNWEAQHPPLYYALIAPLFRATEGLTIKTQVALLRLASWALALAGLLIAAEGARRYVPGGAMVAVGLAAWPFIAPEFLPEMARIGNDSLCLLLAGLAFALLARLLNRSDHGIATAAALGLTLGLGLLTKALFLPIVAGTAALLLLRWVRSRQTSSGIDLVLVAGVALAVGAGWYVESFLATGSFSGSDEFIQYQRQGSLTTALGQHFNPLELVKGVANIVIGFIWGGTWSLAEPNPVLLLGPLLLIAVPLGVWLSRWRLMDDLDIAALFWIVALGGSLIWHDIVLIAYTGSGVGTPGHYLHIVAPALALGVVRGWRWPWLGAAFATLTALFTAYVWTMQAALYSGCATKAAPHNRYQFDQACFIDGHALSVLTYPAWALGLGALVVISVGLVCFLLLRTIEPPEAEELIPING